jgi:lipopolysaccharide export system protein LptA
LAAAASGHAQQKAKPADFPAALSLASKGEPLHIRADRLEFDYQAKQAVYQGNVIVTQGELTLKSERLIVRYEEGEEGGRRLKEVVASGDVRVRRGEREATGERAVFDEARRTVTLSGNAVLREGASRIEGERVVVYLDEGRSEVVGGRKRVKAMLYMKEGEEQTEP